MTNAEYEAYAKAAAAKGEPVYPRDRGTAPKYFGQQYAGSSLKRKNDIRRKRLMKASSRNAGMAASQDATCKALSLACWRTTGEASSIGVPLRFFINEEN